MNAFYRAALTIALVVAAASAFRFSLSDLQAAPVAYSGKIALNGENFDDPGHFRFQLVDHNGSVLWRNSAAGTAVTTPVNRGHYSVLLGDDSTPHMAAIPPNLFLDHPVVFLRVHFSQGDGKPFVHLQPDQRILSAAHALTADIAEQARLADKVKPGAITLDMLSPEVLADFNQTIIITRDMLPPEVLADLDKTITRGDLSSDVLADLNNPIVITRDMLPPDVLADLNQTIIITREMLPPDVLVDLNATLLSPGIVTRDMLAPGVLADLNASIANGSITPDMLSPDVLAQLNSPFAITRDMLPVDVLADLNRSVVITRDMLPGDVLDDLNRTVVITRDMLSGNVLADLNRTITRSMLAPGVRQDLNRTITRSMLPGDVLADLNRTIARGDLPADVLADLNRSVVITRDMLPGDVLADLNRTITRNMLPGDVLADLNRTITRNMLPSDVQADLNATLAPASVTADKLAPGSVTTAQLSEQILKYLKPEITTSPQAPGLVFTGESVTLTGSAEGKYLAYQWNRNGQPIAGATGATFVITDANGTLHDGNYTLTATNDFGSATTAHITIEVNATAANYVVPSIGMDMIWCHPGAFTMGSPANEASRGSDETQTQVTLTQGFYLGKHEVTQAQWNVVMGTSPSQFTGNDRPVEKVNWTEAKGFCEQLTIMEQNAGRLPPGWAYVLPTEAQWEYACRAGTTTIFSWGDTATSTQANFKGTNPYGGATTGPNLQQTTDVGSYGANPWGFFDMHGNVWEWCSDWKANYPNGPLTDPMGPASGSSRVLRGGSWNNPGTFLRSAQRNLYSPGSRINTLGFRAGFRFIPADVAAPELSLLGAASVTHQAGTPWAEPGVSALDMVDGDLTSQVTVTGTVDANATGAYVLTYSSTDAAGNAATVTRTVTVTGAHTVQAASNLEMIWCPPGAFTMGSPASEAGRHTNETEHTVTLTKGFYLGKYEVTQAQYEAVMTGNSNGLSATPSNWPNNANRPVEKVSWDDAQIFLSRLNAAEQAAGRLPNGWAYVLPTESEWEYACRAGTTTAYSWGGDINSSRANFDQSGLSQTRDVGQYSANPWGFYDMHGNVWEWTADWYQAAYPAGTVTDPTGSASGPHRVLRGGSWLYHGTVLRSAERYDRHPGNHDNTLGFRVGFLKSQ